MCKAFNNLIGIESETDETAANLRAEHVLNGIVRNVPRPRVGADGNIRDSDVFLASKKFSVISGYRSRQRLSGFKASTCGYTGGHDESDVASLQLLPNDA